MSERYISLLIDELNQVAAHIKQEQLDALVKLILQAPKVLVAGAGRSGLMMRAFVMRLMHLGIPAYVVGETVTPGFSEGDVLLIGSGSGETASLLAAAQKAKKLDGVIGVITLKPQSSIGLLADHTIQLSGSTKDAGSEQSQSIQPMGSLFEQILLIVLDSIILSLMDKQGIDSQAMYTRHANLE